MSVFWKMVGAVPWAAICAQGLFAEYAVQCFLLFIFLFNCIGVSVLNLFRLRMKAVCNGVMLKMQKVELVLEGVLYILGTVLLVATIGSFPDLRYQYDYKKQVEQVRKRLGLRESNLLSSSEAYQGVPEVLQHGP